MGSTTAESSDPRFVYNQAAPPFWGRWSLVTFAFVCCGIAAAIILPTIRVGDGMEYYAMFLAWSDTARPWMTEHSWAFYQNLFQSQTIGGMLDAATVKNMFPALRIGATADFNHFWFYSLLATIVASPLKFVGIPIGPQSSFLLLHALIFVATLAVAQASNGWRGYWTAVILLIGSPVVWYFNKAHTEFFTVCICLMGLILTGRNQLVAGALMVSLAATQNPGLSLVPIALLAIRGFGNWSIPYSRWEVVSIVATVLLLAAHPTYYLLRYGVATPQLLAGGADIGVGVGTAYAWFLDPDIGLLPNWPLGIVLLVAGIYYYWRPSIRKDSPIALDWGLPFWTFIAVFFFAALISHISTPHINSGATPGLARYALWYIPLFYPCGLALLTVLEGSDHGLQQRAAIGTLTIGVLATAATHLSIVHERYLSPSTISKLIQTYTPGFYDPPYEVFGARYSGVEGLAQVAAVVGPDCHKILILPPSSGSVIFVPDGCSYQSEQIADWVAKSQLGLTSPRYSRIDPRNPSVVKALVPIMIAKDYAFDTSGAGLRLIGWSSVEPTHRWSLGPSSAIELRLPSPNSVALCAAIRGGTYGPQTIGASVDGKQAMEQAANGETELVVPLGKKEGDTTITLAYSNPQIPPNDPRQVAFALRSVRIDACP